MSVQVYIPTPFRRATNNQDRLSLEALDVEALLDELEEKASDNRRSRLSLIETRVAEKVGEGLFGRRGEGR